ncbi:hypothetical protein L0P88_21645 [Muricauda sp. SCSIO 64092]|uniref:hypothetical protein n=1 Tax=Allomuricauda sp. SCSIO 64092 TaxID=2908842 RepID=UPI001FF39229|nr:hypothetical protein [Muricauda sp. SCSIO 64092]UOY06515.1 hypothetical protein L0P88_21645 [Muricauda sp. SCSIO 64092]
MALINIPVNPSLNEKGEFATLDNFLSTPLKPVPFKNADKARNEFGQEYKFNLSTSSKLEIAAIGGIENNHNTTVFIHDSIIYRLARSKDTDPKNIIKGTWWGYGLRIKIMVKNTQFGVDINWGAVSAAAQLGYADAEFEIAGIGITNSDIFKLLPSPTDLNLDSYGEVLEIGNSIRNYLGSADPTGVEYKPLRIEVDESSILAIDPIENDRHLIFTYQKVNQRKRIRDIRKEAIEKGLNPDLVKTYYNEVFQISDEDKKPSTSDRREAKAWLDR